MAQTTAQPFTQDVSSELKLTGRQKEHLVCDNLLQQFPTNLVKRGIAFRFYSPGGSSNLQLQTTVRLPSQTF